MKNHFVFVFILLQFACADRHNKTEQNTDKAITAFQFKKIQELSIQPSLPELMINRSGEQINSVSLWEARKKYIKEMLIHYQYGVMPVKPDSLQVVETNTQADEDRIHSSYDVTITRNSKSITFRMGLIRPSKEGRFPVIIKNDRYRFDMAEIENNKSREKYTKQNRIATDYFVADEAIKRGYVYCKFNREDVALDIKSPKTGRIFDLYPENDWGAITAWAWTYQIVIDWLEKQSFTDTTKIIATGHSRGGKTALCAGIFDERIAITAPNSSGLGGTGSLRFYDFSRGENVQTIAYQYQQFPHWWPDRWYTLKDHINKVPFDTHFAKALIAPRALFNTHARHDFWANPYGTQLTYLAAQPVFELYGVPENNGIHWRDGGHAQGEEDWLALFDYCDQIFYKKPSVRKFNENPYPDTYRYDVLDDHDITKIKTTPHQ